MAIESMVRHLEEYLDLGLVYCNMRNIDEHGRDTVLKEVPDPDAALEDGNGVGLCVMWRRSVWEDIGCFDPVYDTAEDLEYWLRLTQHYPMGRLAGAPLIDVRLHEYMGTVRYAPQQEIAAYRARARYCDNWLEGRRLLSIGQYEAGWVYRSRGELLWALWHYFRAIGHWPLNWLAYRAAVGLLLKDVVGGDKSHLTSQFDVYKP